MKQSLAKWLDSLGVLSLSRTLHRYRPIILMYHRVLDNEFIPGVTPEIFELQLRYLKKHFNIISMNQLVFDIAHNKVQPYSVAITFDDGHQDFYDNAWPLLRNYSVPASLYVTTGFIDKQCWLWPDYLRHILMNTDAEGVRIPNVGILPINPDQLLNTWSAIGDYCLKLNSEDRWPFLRELSVDLGINRESNPEPPFAPLTWDQLRSMHKEGLDVGSHTVSHPILSRLEKDKLRTELVQSSIRIEKELGARPTGICYPNGLAQDTSQVVEEHARQLYRYGLVAYPAQVSPEKIMHLGRWAGPDSLLRFKQVMSGLTWNDNHLGEYR
ncbi:polysaccharide deacetylase family protein [Marinimicrobium sp. LS-A18]|uniref:polysaccharide deacetylase family protein n=1 Tax=Marinimicrobium sp. LS-A18 TaxID=1381596 RepID=UPI000464E343|nr:polysaccharide deacetylase family protein [Marinimicrobium sp. LS-A18]